MSRSDLFVIIQRIKSARILSSTGDEPPSAGRNRNIVKNNPDVSILRVLVRCIDRAHRETDRMVESSVHNQTT